MEGVDELFVGEFSLRANLTDSLLREYWAANVFSFKIQHAFEGLFGSMTQEDVNDKKVKVMKGIKGMKAKNRMEEIKDMKAMRNGEMNEVKYGSEMKHSPINDLNGLIS